jgi:hypothetical protein
VFAQTFKLITCPNYSQHFCLTFITPEISELSMDDVATAAGINKLNNVPNYAWAASDLAQQKTQDALVPLIDQLCERVVYIMKRLTYLSSFCLL